MFQSLFTAALAWATIILPPGLIPVLQASSPAFHNLRAAAWGFKHLPQFALCYAMAWNPDFSFSSLPSVAPPAVHLTLTAMLWLLPRTWSPALFSSCHFVAVSPQVAISASSSVLEGRIPATNLRAHTTCPQSWRQILSVQGDRGHFPSH